MKKIYFFLIVFLPVIAAGQITITQSDLPNVGWGYINAVDPGYSAAIPAGGASQTWNYANLQNINQDSLLFQSSAGTPYAPMFPNANLATYNPNDSTYGYFISNSSGFFLNGGSVAQFNNFVAVYDPPQIFIPVPFTYNSTYSGYSRFAIDTTFGTDSARIILNTQISILADGYGSLILPNLTAPNTLRIKKTSLQTDSLWIKLPLIGWTLSPPAITQSTEYLWLQNGGGTLLLDIDADSLGQTATQSSYRLFFAMVGINENHSPAAVSVFPNPAPDRVTFTFENNTGERSKLAIINQLGETVESYDVSRLNSFTMTTSHLPAGMYAYVTQTEKEIKAKGKFIVLH
ncbi:MAG TPA: T9SS type A sorting domain-containing protein [Bacteroidia bacterium]|nr:T9SS type A sorting domain-containing protein [Bacteroidia bacterium]